MALNFAVLDPFVNAGARIWTGLSCVPEQGEEGGGGEFN